MIFDWQIRTNLIPLLRRRQGYIQTKSITKHFQFIAANLLSHKSHSKSHSIHHTPGVYQTSQIYWATDLIRNHILFATHHGVYQTRQIYWASQNTSGFRSAARRCRLCSCHAFAGIQAARTIVTDLRVERSIMASKQKVSNHNIELTWSRVLQATYIVHTRESKRFWWFARLFATLAQRRRFTCCFSYLTHLQ